MNTYTTLVVDDDKHYLEAAKRATNGNAEYRVLTAPDLVTARALIKANFLHAAFVDLRLDATSDDNVDGLTILRELAQHRSSCRRFLMTQHVDTQRDCLFDILKPGSSLVEGIVFKRDFQQSAQRIISQLADDWLSGAIEIIDDAGLFQRLKGKRLNKPVDITQEEVDFLISSLLGQEARKQITAMEDVRRIRLELLTGGRSRAVVSKGRPELGSGQQGIWCVMKVAPREECEQEIVRYRRYVRWTWSVNRRVELLAFREGDTVGAVCYSFAHQSPKNVTTLEAMFEAKDETALRKLETLFNPDAKEWYSEVRRKEDLALYFASEHRIEPSRILDEAEQFLTRHSREFGLTTEGRGVFQHTGGRICIPRTQIGAGVVRMDYSSCIIHGDLNAGNVLIATDDPDDDRVALIDYSHTGPGPATLDFSVLQVHIRLSTIQSDEAIAAIGMQQRDRQIWQAAWRTTQDERAIQAEGTKPYWERVSLKLLRLMRSNFPKIEPLEHAVTCLLWALRVFRVPSLSDIQRLRILVWIGALCEIIDAEGRK